MPRSGTGVEVAEADGAGVEVVDFGAMAAQMPELSDWARLSLSITIMTVIDYYIFREAR